MDSKILNKLQKIINLRDAAGTEGEAQAAAFLVTKLLYEYNLKESDIPGQININPIIMEVIDYKTTLCSGKWYCDLVTVLCKYNMCRVLITRGIKNNRSYKDKFNIIGKKDNIETVLYLLSYLSINFYNIGVSRYTKDSGFKRSEFLKSFLVGCVQGLMNKYDKLDVSSCKDIIISNDSLIADYIQEHYGKLKKGTKSKESINTRAFNEGYDVGANTELNDVKTKFIK